jgi:hypothetical protein
VTGGMAIYMAEGTLQDALYLLVKELCEEFEKHIFDDQSKKYFIRPGRLF